LEKETEEKLKTEKLSNMTGGWFVGDFHPAIHVTPNFEACVKRYKQGDTEKPHYQKLALEITVVISGRIRMGRKLFGPDDIIFLAPEEICDFEALEDSVVIAVKSPSIPADKVLV
jgi:hypothetical protein